MTIRRIRLFFFITLFLFIDLCFYFFSLICPHSFFIITNWISIRLIRTKRFCLFIVRSSNRSLLQDTSYFPNILRSLQSIHLHHPNHQLLHFLRDIRHWEGKMFVFCLVFRNIGNGWWVLVGKQLKQGGTKGIEICPWSELIIALRHLLAWRIAIGVADASACCCTTNCTLLFTCSKVYEFHHIMAIYHDIGRLDVKMQHSFLMDCLKTIQYLIQVIADLRLCQRCIGTLQTCR